ncbi:uncharacterized protein CELE_K08F8.15 [Caenorhabditis elegans]|uniref:Uncharacterized protein n=1 Tax=Caenorhabditis elegans TaxID=6239 RepID=A0A2K5ATS6_CAEEL|nr:Uncharacterized protein CELE_K08F8.15 [Caenorhabditis elegans]SPC47300.1 Uncharacterized protein CELE_K08F8.15 [Caenorhabditis elegans]|eukprot:NP_001348713.1 Uncharacterized protein CELE_K08F8.15 [Caenorhabditis elegans]
MQMFDVGLV